MTVSNRWFLTGLCLAIILGAIPTAITLTYLPGLFESLEAGEVAPSQYEMTVRHYKLTERVVLAFGPILYVLPWHPPTQATHGYMRSRAFQTEWLKFGALNTLFWLTILVGIPFVFRKLRGGS